MKQLVRKIKKSLDEMTLTEEDIQFEINDCFEDQID